MLQKNYKNEICSKCLRTHCINKDTSYAKEDHSCFVASGCATCKLILLCCNEGKEKSVFELAARYRAGALVPTCFVKPTCENCFKSTHCKKKNVNSFKLNEEDPTNPLCFSPYHSFK